MLLGAPGPTLGGSEYLKVIHGLVRGVPPTLDLNAERTLQRLVVELVAAIGKNVSACPDIGNWNTNKMRYAALKETFPGAVSCDFKARELGPDGEHRKYDLRRCYDIGRQAGFGGPWCLEHAHRDRKTLFRDLGLLRDQLRQWMKSSEEEQ